MNHVAKAIAFEALYQSWRTSYRVRRIIRHLDRAWFASHLLDGYLCAYQDCEALLLV